MRLILPCFALLASTGCWRGIIYHPTHLTKPEIADLAKQSGWEVKHLFGEEQLVGLVRRPSTMGRPWLLYFAGNALSLGDSQSILLTAAGRNDWGLAAWAYRGYDGSSGAPSEAGLLADAGLVAAHLMQTEKVAPEALFLLGQSLGSGVAIALGAELAAHGKAPAGLILVSAYTSMARVFDDHVPIIPVGWMVADQFRSTDHLRGIKSPVLLAHGTADILIRLQHSVILAQTLGERATLLTVQGRGHNDMWNDARVPRAIERFIGASLVD